LVHHFFGEKTLFYQKKHLSLENFTEKTSLCLPKTYPQKHPLKISRHNQTFFFQRGVFFWVFIKKTGLGTISMFSDKINELKKKYSFVDTTFYKKNTVRRFSKETFYMKNINKTLNPSVLSPNPLNPFFYCNTGYNIVEPKFYNFFEKLINKRLFSISDNFSRRISRVRFKPGYSKQWRFFRKDIKLFLRSTTRYQYRLTLLIHKLYSSVTKSPSTMIHIKIIDLLIQTRLVPDF